MTTMQTINMDFLILGNVFRPELINGHFIGIIVITLIHIMILVADSAGMTATNSITCAGARLKCDKKQMLEKL